jgi:nucleotide-binding universal stress UspA family protein
MLAYYTDLKEGLIMHPIKKILAPTDLSELSQSGVRYALELARSLGAEVVVYYAVPLDEFLRYELSHVRPLLMDSVLQKYRSQLNRFLDERFADILPLVEVERVVELGNPDENIVTKAQDDHADLIVISTHGRTGLSHMFTGSVTENVVRHASCPVLSIRPESGERQRIEAAA